MFVMKPNFTFSKEEQVVLETNKDLNISFGDIGTIKEVYIFNNIEMYTVHIENHTFNKVIEIFDIVCTA